MSEPHPPGSVVVKSISSQACGCTITEYSDERKVIAPCLPCGLHAAAESLSEGARMLNQTAMALSAVATTLRKQFERNAVGEVAKKVAHNLRPLRD